MLRKFFTTRFFILPVVILGVAFAIANRQEVTVFLDPISRNQDFLALTMPLFMLMAVTLGLGIVIGGASVWLRQGAWRKSARQAMAQTKALEAEIERLHGELAQSRNVWQPLPSLERPAA